MDVGLILRVRCDEIVRVGVVREATPTTLIWDVWLKGVPDFNTTPTRAYTQISKIDEVSLWSPVIPSSEGGQPHGCHEGRTEEDGPEEGAARP